MGTSEALMRTLLCHEDHPHAYGDKKLSPKSVKKLLGSSPRVWGQADEERQYIANDGIIPTRMGTRSVAFAVDVKTKDHPHAYGDKPFVIAIFAIVPGSSPRVWGQV